MTHANAVTGTDLPLFVVIRTFITYIAFLWKVLLRLRYPLAGRVPSKPGPFETENCSYPVGITVMNAKTPVSGPLSEVELDQLSDFLASLHSPDALTLEGMDGLFSALIAGPETVLPSEYLPLIWGGELPDENAFASVEEANATLSLIMRHWNSIALELETESVHVPLVFEVETGAVPGREWARGFMRGVELAHSSWNELFGSNEEGQLITIPLVAGEVDPEWPREAITKEKGTELIQWMGAGLARSYRHFARKRRDDAQHAGTQSGPLRRATPKVGRNEPCPCGSGKKFKRCCGNNSTPTN